MLPCRMFCESKPCIGGSNEFVFESTAHPKLRIFAVLCFRFPIWLFGSGTGQLSAVNCRIWWPKLFLYIRIKLLVRSDKLGKGVTCPSVTTTRLRRSDVSYAEHWYANISLSQLNVLSVCLTIQIKRGVLWNLRELWCGFSACASFNSRVTSAIPVFTTTTPEPTQTGCSTGFEWGYSVTIASDTCKISYSSVMRVTGKWPVSV